MHANNVFQDFGPAIKRGYVKHRRSVCAIEYRSAEADDRDLLVDQYTSCDFRV